MKNMGFLVSYFLLSVVLGTVSCKNDEVPVPKAGEFTLVMPADKEAGVSLTPAFVWEQSLNATSYRLVISMNADFTAPVTDISGIITRTYTLQTELAENTRYYWKVTAENPGGGETASNIGFSFRTKPGLPKPSPNISAYYVSPNGDDNPGRGTQAAPFKTLGFASTIVPPSEGDTIYLSAGTFEETEPAIIAIGVSVVGAGESKTILSSKGVRISANVNQSDKDFKLWYDGSLIQLTSPHNALFRAPSSEVVAPENGNQTLTGFTIDGNNKLLKAGIWVENRNNVSVHNVTFKNLAQRGAVFSPGIKDWYTYPKFYMTNIKVYDCTFTNSGKDLADETLGNLNIAQLDGAEIYNITINDTEGYGIKFIHDGYFKNVKIHDCNISLNESDSKWGEDIAIEMWNIGPGNEIYNINCNTWLSLVNHPEMFGIAESSPNMKVYKVKMIDNDGNSNKEAVEAAMPNLEISESYFENKGFGIAVWDMGRENITIRNNIFRNTIIHENWAGGSSVYIDNSRNWDFKNIRIYNNIFDLCRMGVRVKGARISNIAISNNIFHYTSISDVESSAQSVSCTNNLKFNGTGNGWLLTGVQQITGNTIQDPGFLKSGNRWETYYQAASAGSAMVDKGVNVGLPYKGTAPDIGRWEF